MPFFSQHPVPTSSSSAFFAEAQFRPQREGEPATVGGRYYDFEEDRILYFGGLFADRRATGSWRRRIRDGVLPRVLLSYDVTDNVQMNAQYSEGFRLGGINDPLNMPLCSPEDDR